MNQLQVKRYCTRVDHKNKNIKYICLEERDHLSKWWCKYCYKEYKLHNLGNIKKLKIYDQPKLKKLLYDQVENKFNYNNILFLQQQLKAIILELEQQVKLLKQSFDELSQYLQQQQDYHKNVINFVSKENFLGLEEKEIQQIKDVLYNRQQEIQRENIISIIKNLNQLSDRMKSVFSEPIECSFFKNSKYKIEELDANNDLLNENIGIQTSANLQYIVLSQSQGGLKLYHNLQLIKQMQFEQSITSIQFSNDSQYLYLGQKNGNLVIISLKDYSYQGNFKLHSDQIHSILIKDEDQIITFSSDNSFIKFNLKKENILKRIQSNSKVNCVELLKKYNLIALCDDNNINIFSLINDSFIIQQQQLSKIKKIQCQGKKIYTFDNATLIIWNISLSKKQAIVLQQIEYNQPIVDVIISQSPTFYIIIFQQSLQIMNNSQCIREIYYSQDRIIYDIQLLDKIHHQLIQTPKQTVDNNIYIIPWQYGVKIITMIDKIK